MRKSCKKPKTNPTHKKEKATKNKNKTVREKHKQRAKSCIFHNNKQNPYASCRIIDGKGYYSLKSQYSTSTHVGVFVGNGVLGLPASLHGSHICSELLLLPLPCLVVLEPIEDILPLYFPILPQPSWNPLYLLSTRRPNSIVIVQVFQYPYLVSSRNPPCSGLPTEKAAFTTCTAAAVFTYMLLLLLLLVVVLLLLVMLRFHKEERKKQQEENKRKRKLSEEKKRWGVLGFAWNHWRGNSWGIWRGVHMVGMERVLRGEDQMDIW